ncbi:MAG: hypothetical protein HY074_02260 [Deltaproteobacteria bacterium]|nr:hypothetical protein [Deltaproteobacteria bacterium]
MFAFFLENLLDKYILDVMTSKRGKPATGPKRKHTRFRPEPTTIAWIDSTGDGGVNTKFRPDLVGLVYEEALKGCGLVLLTPDRMRVGDVVTVKVGEMDPVAAEVRWRKVLDFRVLQVGLQYVD